MRTRLYAFLTFILFLLLLTRQSSEAEGPIKRQDASRQHLMNWQSFAHAALPTPSPTPRNQVRPTATPTLPAPHTISHRKENLVGVLDGAISLMGQGDELVNNNLLGSYGGGASVESPIALFDCGTRKSATSVRVHGFTGVRVSLSLYGTNHPSGTINRVLLARFTSTNTGWQEVAIPDATPYRFEASIWKAPEAEV